MNPRPLAAFVFALMIGTVVGTTIITPHTYLSKELGHLDLEVTIPNQFGEWKIDRGGSAYLVDPQTKELLERIYSQTLSRTYLNTRGDRIMLSIAYGGDQRDTNQVHYPEVCYPAQGFTVVSNTKGFVGTTLGNIPVRRLETNLGQQRYEPVTYWTTVGTKIVRGEIDKKTAEMSYGLRGLIPDGMLVRVSSINRNSAEAFRLQDEFIRDLAASVSPILLPRIMGFTASGPKRGLVTSDGG